MIPLITLILTSLLLLFLKRRYSIRITTLGNEINSITILEWKKPREKYHSRYITLKETINS